MSQEKVTLRYLGTAVNQDKAIAEKFKADTGIEIQYVAVTTGLGGGSPRDVPPFERMGVAGMNQSREI